MKRFTRKMFCGAVLLAFPILGLHARDKAADVIDRQPDSVMDALADEMIRITSDGTRNGIKAEHFRRLAGLVRTFDAHLEENGTNRELDSRLEEDDAFRLNPAQTARVTADYWKTKGVHFDESDLMARLSMESRTYLETKLAIKRRGGVRALHRAIAEAFEQKARELEALAFRDGPSVRRDPVALRGLGIFPRQEFTRAQYDYSDLIGVNVDCLCKAMVTEGQLLTFACLMIPGCEALCVPAAVLLGLEKLMEAYGMCVPSRC